MIKRRQLLIISFLLLIGVASGQEFTRQEADSMIIELAQSKPDLQRIDLLLNLAQFHIFKPGEFQVDFDSATTYIDQAKALNKTINSSDAYGYELLTESLLIKEKGQRAKARIMVEKAVEILEPGANKSYLGSAIFELSCYYD